MKRSVPLVFLLSATLVASQTQITPPDNKYTSAQDVELGQKAAAEARQQMPVMRDDAVTSYVEDIGRRLVAAIPADLRHPEFRYTFEVVNVREINAFALPGGPMFVNRGMIEAAQTEGEVAGVMAHELSHVVLRHGTAQASKATKYEVGPGRRRRARRDHRRRLGQVIAQGTQFGLGAAFLRFGREYERQADLEGAQIMARAGYDPRDMANMFKTIEKQGGSGGPQWLSDHPNPGNRYDYITQGSAVAARRQPDPRHARVRAGARRTCSSCRRRRPPRRRRRPRADGGRPARRGRTRAPTGRVEPPSSQLPDLQRRRPVPGQRAVELAGAARRPTR